MQRVTLDNSMIAGEHSSSESVCDENPEDPVVDHMKSSALFMLKGMEVHSFPNCIG